MVSRGSQRRFRSMGFPSARVAKSTIMAQVRLAIGVEAIRGVVRVRLQNLATVLAGHSSTRASTQRRARASARSKEQRDAFWSRNAYREAR